AGGDPNCEDAGAIDVPTRHYGPRHVGDRAGVASAPAVCAWVPYAFPATPMSLINGVNVRIEDNESMLLCNRVVPACGRLLIGGGVAAMKDHHQRHGGRGAVARWDVHRIAVDVAARVHARVLIAAGARS